MTDREPDLPSGVRWHENGQATISGRALALMQAIDRLFVRWAEAWHAREMSFPTLLSIADLDRLDYFRSFPHLATFPLALDAEEANLRAFARDPVDAAGALRPTRTAPIRDVLTPAACYHVYAHFRGEAFDAPQVVTTRCTCFRREDRYEPLERQWSFSMREIVCIGTPDEVHDVLAAYRETASEFVRLIGLDGTWAHATDPFFDPGRNAKFVMQTIDALKHEWLFDSRLALMSTNVHHTTFGSAFAIARDGNPAHTGCVAFGLERWLYALATTFGLDRAIALVEEAQEAIPR